MGGWLAWVVVPDPIEPSGSEPVSRGQGSGAALRRVGPQQSVVVRYPSVLWCQCDEPVERRVQVERLGISDREVAVFLSASPATAEKAHTVVR